MPRFSISLLKVLALAVAGGLGVGVGVVWSGSGKQRVRDRPGPSADEVTRLRSLEAELTAARATIEVLRGQLAAGQAEPENSTAGAGAPAEGPTDLNTVFEQARPLLRSLGPLLDGARQRGARVAAERRLAELSEQYNLTAEQQETVKKWFEQQSAQEAEMGKELLNKPGLTLQDMVAAGRGRGRNEQDLDVLMAETLDPAQLTAYQRDRLQQRAATVEREATRRVTQLDQVVGLDEAQQDKVFALMARSSPDYDPSMQLDGLGADTAGLSEGASRDEAILAVLTPEQASLYEADRQRRREEAAKGFEAMGLKPPGDGAIFESRGR